MWSTVNSCRDSNRSPVVTRDVGCVCHRLLMSKRGWELRVTWDPVWYDVRTERLVYVDLKMETACFVVFVVIDVVSPGLAGDLNKHSPLEICQPHEDQRCLVARLATEWKVFSLEALRRVEGDCSQVVPVAKVLQKIKLTWLSCMHRITGLFIIFMKAIDKPCIANPITHKWGTNSTLISKWIWMVSRNNKKKR